MPSDHPESEMLLTLHPTYYRSGFFNVPVAHDGQLRPTEGAVELFLGETRRRIDAKVDRSANRNGTARVMGGTALRDWFQRECREMDQIAVHSDSPSKLHLRKASR